MKTFADVKGCPDAKAELEEVVAFLKHPDRFTRCDPGNVAHTLRGTY